MNTVAYSDLAEPNVAPPSVLKEENKKFLTCFDISLFLASVTLAEWIIVTLPWNYWIVVVPLLLMSVAKFVAVVAWFMHLRWDHKLCSIIFVGGLVLALGTAGALLLIFRGFPHG